VRIAPYHTVVIPRTSRRAVSLAVVLAILAGCGSDQPSPAPSADGSPVSGAPAPSDAPAPPSASPSGPQAIEFPLAVVTGITNLKHVISIQELRRLARRGELAVPCGVDVQRPNVPDGTECVPADGIAPLLEADQSRVALLPPGLVEPATKVLPLPGDGPFRIFGPDLFGDPEARALDYPITAVATPGADGFDAAWAAYDPSQVWTLTNLGSLCADRWAAYQAATLGKGWHWIFNGGTARYAAPAPIDPPVVPPYENAVPVNPIDTGNDGATATVVRRSDVAIADHECPVVPSAGWVPRATNDGLNVFSVPEEVLPEWRDTLGLDAVYLAANHMSDQGVAGIRSTLDLMDEYGLRRTGLGMNLREALEPTYVEVAGLRVGFVAFNDVPGVAAAGRDTPGVPWITRENVRRGVRLARQGGADLVICNPQWWGGAEYHDDLYPLQAEQLRWFDGAGCDHVIGSGTHVAGPLLLRDRPDGPSVVLVSPGNYVFGQGWWQETQEGVILDLTFRGTTLVNVRMRPTVQIDAARPALLHPEREGSYVLQRIWKYSTID
jgi:hypothetical protein